MLITKAKATFLTSAKERIRFHIRWMIRFIQYEWTLTAIPTKGKSKNANFILGQIPHSISQWSQQQKHKVHMNVWMPQAKYPCRHFSDTSWFTDWSIPQVSWRCTSNWPSPFPQCDKDVGVHEIKIQSHVSNKEVFYNTIHSRFFTLH